MIVFRRYDYVHNPTAAKMLGAADFKSSFIIGLSRLDMIS
jgi:hypothetical protein